MPRPLGVGQVPPLYRAYDPDDSADFHAARLLVLLRRCGEGRLPTIEGRTKLAKLDFFLRYPAFLERAQRALASRGEPITPYVASSAEVEAPMIRYRFGPWDPRYREFLAFLQTRGLVRVTRGKPEKVTLTARGRDVA